MQSPDIEAPFTLGAQIEARARHPELADRPLVRSGDAVWSYRRFRDECLRFAHLLLGRLGTGTASRPAHVAMLLDNQPELLALYGGCGYAGHTLFGINTGLVGDTLAGVVNASGARLLVVGERHLETVRRVQGQLEHVGDDAILVVPAGDASACDAATVESALCEAVGESGSDLTPPDVEVTPETNLMVIYTSGTTGLPKGINNNHFKLMVIGLTVSRNLELSPVDCGYACMPLFHSNAIFLGFQPALYSGASIGLRERFSASSFWPDVRHYGVTWWNYVGEPVHYVLSALEREFGGDEERILREVAGHPRNRFRVALGNGASPPDIDRFIRWFGLEDMYELYGSTEAAISTFRRRTDPRGSVGEITDDTVQILDEKGHPCPPAQLGPDGKILNYAEAVGEICRVATDTSLFQGYFDNPEANSSKYRDGVYHSGDLGHIVIRDGRRYLYFDGRTDDWIRKDGENFSAAQVGRLIAEHPHVALAAAYGVPCAVSDELVMVALELVPGARFDPQGFFDFCDRQTREGGMDRKWFPDFVRLVDGFEYTQTQKILVRNLKREHFDRRRLPEAPIYWRRRGTTTFEPLGRDDFDRLHAEFVAAERDRLLEG